MLLLWLSHLCKSHCSLTVFLCEFWKWELCPVNANYKEIPNFKNPARKTLCPGSKALCRYSNFKTLQQILHRLEKNCKLWDFFSRNLFDLLGKMKASIFMLARTFLTSRRRCRLYLSRFAFSSQFFLYITLSLPPFSFFRSFSLYPPSISLLIFHLFFYFLPSIYLPAYY